MSIPGTAPQFIYIHPLGNPHEEVIPYGLIGAINNIKQEKLGIYDFQLELCHLAGAKVIAIDIHWYHSLAPAIELARYLRKQTQAKLITGGYTAHLFAAFLMADKIFDTVITGPAEAQLPHYCGEQAVLPVPLAQSVYNATDYFSVDWFPAFAMQQHREWPVLPFTKGPCQLESTEPGGYCCTCYAHREKHNYFFAGCPQWRSPESVKADLIRLSQDTAINDIFLFHDPFSVAGNPYAGLLQHSYALNLHLYPAAFYNAALLDKLQACFQRTALYFYCLNLETFSGSTGHSFLAACRERGIPVTCLALRPPTAQVAHFLESNNVILRDNYSDTLALPSPFAVNKEALFNEYYRRSLKFFLEKNLFKLAPAYIQAVDNWLGGRTVTIPCSGSDSPGDTPVDRKIAAGAGFPDTVFAVAYLVKKRFHDKIMKIVQTDLVSPPLLLNHLVYNANRPCFVINYTLKPGCAPAMGCAVSFCRGKEVFLYALYLPFPDGETAPEPGQPFYLQIEADLEHIVLRICPGTSTAGTTAACAPAAPGGCYA